MTSTPLDVISLALLPAILWGFAPILDKRGMAASGSSVQASLVVVVVDSTIYWIMIALFCRGSAFSELSVEVLAIFAFAGVIGTALGRVAIFVGVDRVGASLNGAILSARPLFATLIALVVLGEPLGPVTAIEIVVLVSGLALLAASRGGDLEG